MKRRLNLMVQTPTRDGDLFNEALIRSYVDSPRFLERAWLWQRVQTALSQPNCRFVLLTAEPGAGKSGFVAWVADKHPNWPRYFILGNRREDNACANLDNLGHFYYKSLCEEYLLRYGADQQGPGARLQILEG
jgi:hypothetical protein